MTYVDDMNKSCGEAETDQQDIVPFRDNPQRTLALNLINTLGFKEATRFARERQWHGVIVQIYRGLQSGPA